MSIFGLTVYILIWPVIATLVLLVLIVCVIKDFRAARRSGEQMV